MSTSRYHSVPPRRAGLQVEPVSQPLTRQILNSLNSSKRLRVVDECQIYAPPAHESTPWRQHGAMQQTAKSGASGPGGIVDDAVVASGFGKKNCPGGYISPPRQSYRLDPAPQR